MTIGRCRCRCAQDGQSAHSGQIGLRGIGRGVKSIIKSNISYKLIIGACNCVPAKYEDFSILLREGSKELVIKYIRGVKKSRCGCHVEPLNPKP